MSKTKLIPFVDYYPLRNYAERVKPENLRNEPTVLPPGTINKNSWKDVITYCQLHGYKPSDIYKLIFDRHKPKITEATIKIGILVYDKLQLNKKKKKSLLQNPTTLNFEIILDLFKGVVLDQLLKLFNELSITFSKSSGTAFPSKAAIRAFFLKHFQQS